MNIVFVFSFAFLLVAVVYASLAVLGGLQLAQHAFLDGEAGYLQVESTFSWQWTAVATAWMLKAMLEHLDIDKSYP